MPMFGHVMRLISDVLICFNEIEVDWWNGMINIFIIIKLQYRLPAVNNLHCRV